MYEEGFDSIEEIKRKIFRIAGILDFETFRSAALIFYDTIKIASIRLKKKQEISKKKREKCYLSPRSLTKITELLDYFYANDRYTIIEKDSRLAQCYYPEFSEAAALRYFECFMKGTCIKDKFGRQIMFTEKFSSCLYKDEEGRHTKEPDNYKPYRGKRLPLIKDTVINTSNILERIDEFDNLEMMYVSRYKDFNGGEYYFVVIAEKFKKDVVNPFIAKTAFPVLTHGNMLRRLEKYKPLQ